MNARAQWRPWMQRIYGIKPWEMREFSTREIRGMSDDLKALKDQESGEV